MEYRHLWSCTVIHMGIFQFKYVQYPQICLSMSFAELIFVILLCFQAP